MDSESPAIFDTKHQKDRCAESGSQDKGALRKRCGMAEESAINHTRRGVAALMLTCRSTVTDHCHPLTRIQFLLQHDGRFRSHVADLNQINVGLRIDLFQDRKSVV